MCLFFLAIYRKLNICECRTRKAFMEERFSQIRHVILDEVHNFQAKDGDWLGKARTLVRQHLERESSDDDYASDNEKVSESSSESETEQDNPDTNSVAGPDPEHSIWQNDGPGYLWCFMDKGQSILKKSETGIPQRLRQTFLLRKVIRNSKRIFEHAEKFLDRRTWSLPVPRHVRIAKELSAKDPTRMAEINSWEKAYGFRKEKSVTIGHDFDGEQSEEEYSRGERIACLIGVLESLLKEGYSKGDIAVLCLTEPLEGNELKQLQEFTLTVNAERNDDDNVVLSTVREYGGLERPIVVIVRESFDYNSKDVSHNRVNYCAFTRGMVKLITLKEKSWGRKRKESN